LRAADPITDPLRGLGEQALELGIENRHTSLGLQESNTVLAVLDHRTVNVQSELATAHGDHLSGGICPGQQRRHADFRNGRERA
jgi:hypothetical protein